MNNSNNPINTDAITCLAVFSWITVIIPAVLLLRECMYSFIHGTTHGFNSNEILYGFGAFADTFMFYLCFFLPLFILWCGLFVLSVSLTVAVAAAKKTIKQMSK